MIWRHTVQVRLCKPHFLIKKCVRCNSYPEYFIYISDLFSVKNTLEASLQEPVQRRASTHFLYWVSYIIILIYMYDRVLGNSSCTLYLTHFGFQVYIWCGFLCICNALARKLPLKLFRRVAFKWDKERPQMTCNTGFAFTNFHKIRPLVIPQFVEKFIVSCQGHTDLKTYIVAHITLWCIK